MSGHRPPFVRARTLLAATAAALAVLVAPAAGVAAPGAPPGAARDLAQVYFSNTLTRAEVISLVGHSVHDYRIDEGRVTAARPNAIDLLERDGTRQTIAVSASTQVVGPGRLFGLRSITRGTRVVAITDGVGPATQIRPSGSAGALGKLFFGVTLVRAEVLTYSAKTLHDVRIDEGRIVLVRPAAITLLERDGTRQTIAFNSSTVVTVSGQPADLTALTRGLAAITVRVGDAPAQEIRLFPAALGLRG
jgi:hypothetical protein